LQASFRLQDHGLGLDYFYSDWNWNSDYHHDLDLDHPGLDLGSLYLDRHPYRLDLDPNPWIPLLEFQIELPSLNFHSNLQSLRPQSGYSTALCLIALVLEPDAIQK
jgi:hypothetical protein